MKFALIVFCPLKELAWSSIRTADGFLAQISHKQWAELGKAGGQRYWKLSSAALQYPQEGLMKTLAFYLQTPQQSFPIHPVALISFRIQRPELVNLQHDFLFFSPVTVIQCDIKEQLKNGNPSPFFTGASSNI